MGETRPRRIVVGVTGASGSALAAAVLGLLGEAGVERHLVVSPAGKRTAHFELPERRLESLADVVHHCRDIGAPLASGAFPTDGMIVVPCSVRTLSSIAYGITDSLLSRAADVTLKERRRLVLAVRESPLHLGHLRAMTAATEAGAIVAPPMPLFYAKPTSISELVEHLAGRLVGLLGVETAVAATWEGDHLAGGKVDEVDEVAEVDDDA